MKRDLQVDRLRPADQLPGEELLDGLVPPADTKAACDRVRARLEIANATSPAGWQSLRWLTRIAAGLALVASAWWIVVVPSNPDSAPRIARVAAGGGFPELHAMGIRLASLEQSISKLGEREFWGDSMTRTSDENREVYQR